MLDVLLDYVCARDIDPVRYYVLSALYNAVKRSQANAVARLLQLQGTYMSYVVNLCVLHCGSPSVFDVFLHDARTNHSRIFKNMACVNFKRLQHDPLRSQLERYVCTNRLCDPTEVVSASFRDNMEHTLVDLLANPLTRSEELHMAAWTAACSENLSDDRKRAWIARCLRAPGLDPAAFGNAAVQIAVQQGCCLALQLLLEDPRVDPSARHNAALSLAVQRRNEAAVLQLLAHPRVDLSAFGALDLLALQAHSPAIYRVLLRDPRASSLWRKLQRAARFCLAALVRFRRRP